MFAGHIGAGLAVAGSQRGVNAGVFVFAALLLDLALWSFVLLGWETVAIGPDFAASHQPEFVFPWSHGLAASLVWSAAAGLAVFAACPGLGGSRDRAATLVGAAVFSHWVLDVVVHRAELPVAGPGSALLGLGLWQRLPLALALEALIVLGGLALFLPRAALSRVRKAVLAALCLIVLGFTVFGMTVAPAPPSAEAMAASSLVMIVIVCALVGWLARPGREPEPASRPAPRQDGPD